MHTARAVRKRRINRGAALRGRARVTAAGEGNGEIIQVQSLFNSGAFLNATSFMTQHTGSSATRNSTVVCQFGERVPGSISAHSPREPGSRFVSSLSSSGASGGKGWGEEALHCQFYVLSRQVHPSGLLKTQRAEKPPFECLQQGPNQEPGQVARPGGQKNEFCDGCDGAGKRPHPFTFRSRNWRRSRAGDRCSARLRRSEN